MSATTEANPRAQRVKALQEKQASRKRVKASQGDLLEGLEPAQKKRASKPTPPEPKSVTVKPPAKRKKPQGADQQDFFAPMLYDVGAKDDRGVLDVAVYRLSKRDKRANQVMRYELPDGFVQVTSGPYGMASVWDYDLVLMAISHLTEAMNKFADGLTDEIPPQTFRPHISEVLKFCRKDNGGNQKDFVVEALNRLSTTHVAIERTINRNGESKLINSGDNLIHGTRVISNARTKKVEYVEYRLANRVYEEITSGAKPDVLTLHPDYFLMESGIERFLYRLARKAAGKSNARWGFKTIYTRSGSTSKFKEFCRMLREIIEDNTLPEYHLVEEEGVEGPVLCMVHRNVADKWADPTPPEVA
ncbi:replication protein RepA [Pseudomonas fulva]|uniref:replication initiator protein A n=1 Tax=Pseudomonas fulva TaxID=47880 RepID=UPI000F7B7DE7|nr:replication initiator protein A [Pseudomonas fulva]MBA1218253.1 replication protein RepA [Pseudomonas fulva]RRW59551.1 replication protein RepA [Pseudomonas fulva]